MKKSAFALPPPVARACPRVAALAFAALVSACAVGPDYVAPTLAVPAAYKEPGPWKTAEPRPALSGQAWWRVYHDDTLDALMRDAKRANQDLRVAEAQVRQARALADEARASLFPAVGIDAAAQRARAEVGGVPRTA